MRKPSIVVLDPHGDLALSVAKDRANLRQNRLVYVQFKPLHGKTIHFNPFELSKPTEETLNRAQLQFAGAIEQIIGEDFTPRQRTLIRSCLGVILHKPDTSLVDLVRLLQDNHNADLLQYGQKQLPNLVDRQFFIGSFNDSSYRVTKQALISRLTDIIRDPIVRQFICHGSSFDLGQLLDRGKVLVVRFDPFTQGSDTIRTIGQLLNASILSHVLGRPKTRRYPIHMFVDECQYFVSPSISEVLGEGRKFGLYITLASQRLERINADLQNAILGNVGNLWIGGCRHLTAERLAKETNLSADKIRQLHNLDFLHVSTGEAVKHHHLKYIGNRYAMKPEDWHKITKEIADRYYRFPNQKKSKKANSKQSNWTPSILTPDTP